MDREAFQEIMQSPLDERTPLSPLRRLLLAAGAGLLVGILAAVPWAIDVHDDAVGAVTTSTTAPEDPEPPVGLHPGFAPLDQNHGLRVEWIRHTGDVVLVAVAAAVPSDADPERVRSLGTYSLFQEGTRSVGRWELCPVPERCVAALEEVFDRRAVGMVTLVFPAAGITPIDAGAIDRMALYPVSGAGNRTVTVTYAAGDLPIVRPDPGISIPATELVDAGAEGGTNRTGLSYLVVDLLEIDADYGAVAWHFDGPEDVGPILQGWITLDDGTDNPAHLMPAELAGDTFYGADPMPPTPARSGTLRLIRPSHTGTGDDRLRSIEATWQVSWARYGAEWLEVPFDHLRPED